MLACNHRKTACIFAYLTDFNNLILNFSVPDFKFALHKSHPFRIQYPVISKTMFIIQMSCLIDSGTHIL